MPRCDLMEPSFSSNGVGGTCQKSVPSCGTSNRSGKNIPSLLLVLVSMEGGRRRDENEKIHSAIFQIKHSSCFQLFFTSTTSLSDIFFLGRTSLFLRWTWYIFSAATQDLGLSSGGMVIPYSQPSVKRHSLFQSFPL